MKNLLLLLAITMGFSSLNAQTPQKHRLIVLTDIEADPDDTQSLVRLLLYSNEIEIKGIVATTSCWLKTQIHPESVHKIIQAYEKVQPNLLLHKPGYPTAESLQSLVKKGLPIYGMEGVGPAKNSEGSDWIISELEKEDERPLWIAVWGGSNTLAQSLYKIREEKSPKVQKELIAKLRVYAISDQDDSGIWIRNNFPGLFYIVTPGDDYGTATWTGIHTYVDGIDNSNISNSWIARNIQQGHGPLGAVYPDVAWSMEGDTPSFLPLILNGLNNPEHPEWGGWGGRYAYYLPDFSMQKKGNSGVPAEPETRKIWTNASDTYKPYVANEFGRTIKPDTNTFRGSKVTLWRWRDEIQNDFAARMDWCIKPYAEANHAPVIVLSHPEEITVKSGKRIFLDAFETTDPDSDAISFLWFNYPEAGTLNAELRVEGTENAHMANFVAPIVKEAATVHFIVKVTDKGDPQLTSYKRIVVTIEP